jgi:hypothetical protein
MKKLDGKSGAMPVSFWIALVPGIAAIAFGVHTAMRNSVVVPLGKLARWVIGLGVGHDALVVPIVLVATIIFEIVTRLVVHRSIRRPSPDTRRVHPLRSIIRGAAALSALIVAFSWPSVKRYGEKPDNPSALPLKYGRNVIIVLILIWLVAAALMAIRYLRRRASQHVNLRVHGQLNPVNEAESSSKAGLVRDNVNESSFVHSEAVDVLSDVPTPESIPPTNVEP